MRVLLVHGLGLGMGNDLLHAVSERFCVQSHARHLKHIQEMIRCGAPNMLTTHHLRAFPSTGGWAPMGAVASPHIDQPSPDQINVVRSPSPNAIISIQ